MSTLRTFSDMLRDYLPSELFTPEEFKKMILGNWKSEDDLLWERIEGMTMRWADSEKRTEFLKQSIDPLPNNSKSYPVESID